MRAIYKASLWVRAAVNTVCFFALLGMMTFAAWMLSGCSLTLNIASDSQPGVIIYTDDAGKWE